MALIKASCVGLTLLLLISSCQRDVRPRRKQPARTPHPIARPPVETDPLRDALSRLSTLARYVDSGKGTFGDVKDKTLRPEDLMWEIRKLVHEQDDRSPRLLEYVRSSEEPIAARLMAVLSIGDLWTEGSVTVLCAILAAPPDLRLAKAAIMGHYIGGDRVKPDHGFGLTFLEGFGLPPGYGYSGPMFGPRHSIAIGAPAGKDVSPFVEALLNVLDRQDDDQLRMFALCLVETFSGRPEFSRAHRSRFKRHAESIYLAGKPGFHVLYIHYERMQGFLWTREELIDLLGRGLHLLPPLYLLIVLDQIALSQPEVLQRDPFKSHIGRALDLLRDPPRGCGYDKSSAANLRRVASK